jgi:3-methyladenine DNA glycosylase AlkD
MPKSRAKPTTKADVLAHLKAEQDPRGIANWKQSASSETGLQSYGIGLTRLRAYAKTIGKDPALAKQLWKTKVYEAKVLALLVDDPKSMTIEQAETQVEELAGGYLSHVFSSCDAPLAKTTFAVELLDKWIRSKDPIRRCCGYGLLYEVSKSKKQSAPDEATFLSYVDHIDKQHAKESTDVLMSMAGALMGIGKRTKQLNKAALRVAKKIGPIDFDSRGQCDPFDVAKHLTSDYLKKKLGL